MKLVRILPLVYNALSSRVIFGTTPTNITDDAVGLAQKLGVDCLVALGGRSIIGLGKAIALHTDLKIVITTSYAVSEATPLIGQTEETHTMILPHAIAYNVSYAKSAIAKVASSLSAENAAQAVYDLAKGTVFIERIRNE
ncbi:hypothetical protein BDZ94DRAFT_1325718 [Collybia nuda]|uniref:Alcohol dehydrogenase iron-type/glycerol dehydrogenase GldA domain-containing protein n=1 Tax=Collybia nuda TaxID=64659 RepID=A0A9P6CA81_9AGAR|nr:hypothetical protein BDZ94DRAFT_1325718 [Collybia nuda]